MKKESATFGLSKHLLLLLLGSMLLSVIAMCLSVFSFIRPIEQATTMNESRSTPASEVIIDDQDSPTVSTVTYTNKEIGLSFDYPSGYRVSESNKTRDLDQGELLSMTVLDENNNVVLMAQATSPDYAMGVSEGCCYYFTGTLDASKSVAEMSSTVEDQLREIFVPYRADVGGIMSLGFFYANDYVTTNVVAAHITPIDSETYSNVFFTSGALYSEEGTYSEKIDDVRNIFNLEDLKMGDELYPGLDSEKQQIYNDIMNTITWK